MLQKVDLVCADGNTCEDTVSQLSQDGVWFRAEMSSSNCRDNDDDKNKSFLGTFLWHIDSPCDIKELKEGRQCSPLQ